jgi:hypothetical protein
MESQNKMNAVFRGVLSGTGIALLLLLIGTFADYILTQAISQFFIADCSEDCYFRIFNSIFALVVLISIAGGARTGMCTYRRLAEK